MEIIENISGEDIALEVAADVHGEYSTEEPMGRICEYPEGSEDLCIPFSWWLKDEPNMDDRLEEAGSSLDKMTERLEIHPVRIYETQTEMLFLARFEAVSYLHEFEHRDALSGADVPEDTILFVDFLDGMSCGAAELVGIIGELSSSLSDIKVLESDHKSVPEMHASFFKYFDFGDQDHVPFGYLWLEKRSLDNPYMMLSKNLSGESSPAHCHWWFRFLLADEKEDMRWPVPGEFLSFCPRIWPTMAWNFQGSNPFMFSGNWIETVYYTNARILEVIEETEEKSYPTYRIQYRKYEIIAKPTDFAMHEVDERVTILRLSDKTSWTWKDLTEFNTEEWVIAPISFYDDVANEEE